MRSWELMEMNRIRTTASTERKKEEEFMKKTMEDQWKIWGKRRQ